MSSAASSPPLTIGRPRSTAGRAGGFLSGLLLLTALMLLIAVVVAGANGLRVRVEQTGSMAPVLQPGDLVLVKQVPVETIRQGDIIGVRTAAGLVIVHRVKRIDGRPGALHVTTQGDANPTSEDWTIRKGSNVALVRGSVPSLGSAVDALKGPFTAFAVLTAGLLLALSQLRSIWKRSA